MRIIFPETRIYSCKIILLSTRDTYLRMPTYPSLLAITVFSRPMEKRLSEVYRRRALCRICALCGLAGQVCVVFPCGSFHTVLQYDSSESRVRANFAQFAQPARTGRPRFQVLLLLASRIFNRTDAPHGSAGLRHGVEWSRYYHLQKERAPFLADFFCKFAANFVIFRYTIYFFPKNAFAISLNHSHQNL